MWFYCGTQKSKTGHMESKWGLPSRCAQEVILSTYWDWNAFSFLPRYLAHGTLNISKSNGFQRLPWRRSRQEKDPEHTYSVMLELELGRQVVHGALRH